MIKRVVIAGCRDYNNYQEAKEYIDFCISKIRNKYTLIFVLGGCKGADLLGERYAIENDWKIEKYPADWKNMVREQNQKETNKWQKSVTILFVFGMERAKVQNQ